MSMVFFDIGNILNCLLDFLSIHYNYLLTHRRKQER